MSASGRRTGVLLINLGTPRAASVRSVRRYLREFLSDPRVLDMPALTRWLLLHLVILPFRAPRSAKQYRSIWLPEGSPLLVHGRALCEGVAKALGDAYAVALAMRYQQPSIAKSLSTLTRADVDRVIALPLFPQYSSAATGSALARVLDAAGSLWNVPVVETVGAFYDDPGFLAASAEVAKPQLEAFEPDHVLMSYHGLPERHIRKSDRSGGHCFASDRCCEVIGAANRHCYRAQCVATTRALAARLELAPDRHSLAFQSRLGRTPWIQPYTDRWLPELASRGVRRLAVMCPGFVADCLETIEEIGIRGRAQWKELGGKELLLVPSLNAHPAWVRTVASWIHTRSERDATRTASAEMR